MIFRLNIDPKCNEEVVANVHERTSMIDEIEKIVTRENSPDHITGYLEDEIKILALEEIECFFVEDEKTYALDTAGKRYIVKKRFIPKVEKYLKKGTKIVVEGEIRNNNYEKDGKTVYSDQIIANNVEFAESKNAQGGGDYPNAPSNQPTGDAGDGFNQIEDATEDDLPFI